MEDLQHIADLLDDVQMQLEKLHGFVHGRIDYYRHRKDQIKVICFNGEPAPSPDKPTDTEE